MATEAPKDSFGKVRCTKEEPIAKDFQLRVLKGSSPPAFQNSVQGLLTLARLALLGRPSKKTNGTNDVHDLD